MGMIRSILKYMIILNFLWGEVVRYFIYFINRVVTRVLDKISYYVFKKKKLSVEYIRVFGCLSYVKIDYGYFRKFDDRIRKLVYFGIEFGFKVYRFYDFINRRIVVSRDVIFDEN